MRFLNLRLAITLDPILKMIFKAFKKMKSPISTLSLGSGINGIQMLRYDAVDV